MPVFPLLLSLFPVFSLLRHCQNVTLAYMCTQNHQGRNIQHAECRIHPALQQRHGCWDNLKLRSTRRKKKQQRTTPKKPPLVNFIGNIDCYVGWKPDSVFFGEKITVSYLTICDTHVDSSEEWHSCYQSNCFIKQTSALSEEYVHRMKQRKIYNVLLSPFPSNILGSLICCCPGRQVCWIHVCKTLECTFCVIPSQNAFTQRCPPAVVQIWNVSL